MKGIRSGCVELGIKRYLVFSGLPGDDAGNIGQDKQRQLYRASPLPSRMMHSRRQRAVHLVISPHGPDEFL